MVSDPIAPKIFSDKTNVRLIPPLIGPTRTEMKSYQTITNRKRPLIRPSPDRSDLRSYYCLEPNHRPCVGFGFALDLGLITDHLRLAPQPGQFNCILKRVEVSFLQANQDLVWHPSRICGRRELQIARFGNNNVHTKVWMHDFFGAHNGLDKNGRKPWLWTHEELTKIFQRTKVCTYALCVWIARNIGSFPLGLSAQIYLES